MGGRFKLAHSITSPTTTYLTLPFSKHTQLMFLIIIQQQHVALCTLIPKVCVAQPELIIYIAMWQSGPVASSFSPLG